MSRLTDMNAKMQAEKAYTAQGIGGAMCGQQMSPDCVQQEAQRPMTTAECTFHSLSETAYRADVESEKAKRALDILNRHPEFMEFLELLRSGLV